MTEGIDNHDSQTSESMPEKSAPEGVSAQEQPKRKKPQENFPIDSFRYLEAKLQEIRKLVMQRASRIAKAECSNGAEVYTIQKQHVDLAFHHELEKPERLKLAIGVDHLDRKDKPGVHDCKNQNGD